MNTEEMTFTPLFIAFLLSLLAGIFTLTSIPSYLMELLIVSTPLVRAVGLIKLISGIIIIVGAIMINSNHPNKIKIGGILVLIFSIVPSIVNWNLVSLINGSSNIFNFIGTTLVYLGSSINILGFIGGILALVEYNKASRY